MSDAHEQALMAALRRGEAAAFDALYERYRARVFGFLARLCQDRALAEDLFQETWLRLATHAHRLRADTRPAAWLFTVACNLHRSQLRRRRRETAHRARLDAVAEDPVSPDSPCDLAVAGELSAHLERALAALPPLYREALLLVAVERMEPYEAAAVLGTSPESLRQRVARGRALLRAALERLDGPGPAAAAGGGGTDAGT